jgi:hypothetical protein
MEDVIEIISEDEEEKDSPSRKVKRSQKVFVMKKIQTDEEWFSQVLFT